ncbi:hypothetical protein OG264_36435 [Streptomyces xanthophaeus]|uniref:hypothetical protein n=1 Tax=Streptomyces xanthophaeus TaxID=67385 RepID=UPI003862EE32|nr:hypothetical protein OG264_36435 [Streptomyces xanthophaeus]WST58497.1 hypothetical protein OG605_02000 [Streptomyces xanthophaeus]
MTAYVITVPGTFVHEVPAATRAALARRLRPQDPARSDLGEVEELDLLTVNEDGTFCLRLEVEAADRAGAQDTALGLVATALKESGLSEQDAPLGPAIVTGIDSTG